MGTTTIPARRLRTHEADSFQFPRRRVSRTHPVLSRVLEIAFEFTALVAAWYGAVEFRLLLNPLMSIQFSRVKLEATAPPLVGILGLWLLTKFWLDSRRNNQTQSASLYSMRFAETIILVSAITIVAAFFFQGFGAPVSRSFVLIYTALSYLVLLLTSGFEQHAWGALMARWPGLTERVAILGTPEDARAFSAGLQSAGASFAGAIVPTNYRPAVRESGQGVPVLGTTGDVAEVINREQLNRVIILSGTLPEDECDRCTLILHRMGVVTSRAVASAWTGGEVSLSTEFGMHLLEMRPIAFARTNEVIKFFFDTASSIVLLIALSPVLIGAALLVKLTSQGPVLYRSRRVGKGGRHFTFLKFRTMVYDPDGRRKVLQKNEHEGHIFKIKRDPRITGVGRILRRYSIDELPQLLNVLRGEMSLLGPRPLPAEDLGPDGMSDQYMAWAEQRSTVKPGITGLWQIRGRSDLTFHEMVELDLEYVRNWSLLLDLKILLATPLVVITGRGAY